MFKKHKSLFQILILICILGMGIFLYFTDPSQSQVAPKCLFKLATGYDCPGCGFQRAVHAFLHGHWLEALRFNAFLVVAIPYLFALLLAEYIVPKHNKPAWIRVLKHPLLIGFYIVLFFAWFFIRNYWHL